MGIGQELRGNLGGRQGIRSDMQRSTETEIVVTKASRIGVGRWETSLRLGCAGTGQSRTGGTEKYNQK